MRLACAALVATLAASASAADPNVISRLELRQDGAAVVLTIEGSRPPSFTTFATERPARFVIDVAGGELRPSIAELARDAGPVEGVRAEQLAATSTARVAVALRGALEGAEVRAVGNALVVRFAGATASPNPVPAERSGASQFAPRTVPAPDDRTPPATATPNTTPTTAASTTPTPTRTTPPAAQTVLEFGFRQLPERSRVYVRTAGTPRFTLEERDDALVVTLDRARVTRGNDVRPLDTSFFRTAVARVTPRRVGAEYVLEIALREKVAWQQHVEGDLLAVDFERPAVPAAAR
jgi:colicin import membrane protein